MTALGARKLKDVRLSSKNEIGVHFVESILLVEEKQEILPMNRE